MSTYALMRILESAPRRYDRGMRLISFGLIDRAYDRIATHIDPGMQVLDVGCGTGALTLRAAARGARVKGIDVSADMLEIARQRVRGAGYGDAVELVEEGVALLDGEAVARFDGVMSGLCFSELSDDEIGYALGQIRRILRPGGVLLLVDEVRPPGRAMRIALGLVRAPLSVLAYVVAGQTTHAVDRLPERVRDAGLTVESVVTSGFGSLCELVARKPVDEAP